MPHALPCLALAACLALAIGCAEPPDSTPRSGGDAPTVPTPEVAEAPTAEPPPPEAPTAEPPSTRAVTIGMSGDILIHRKVWRSAEEHADVGGFRHVFEGLRSVIGADEVALANLETPLSIRVPPETGDPPVMGAPGEVAEALVHAGFDAVAVANNHSYDQTSAGMGDTLTALEGARLGAAGGGASAEAAERALILTQDDVRVAFLAVTERINRGPGTQGPELVHIARWDDVGTPLAITRAREEADLVVVSIHWSHDFRTVPMERQRARARAMIDAGADLVMGHGPHVLQEVERVSSPRGEAVVAYSLGNLVSNQALRWFPGRSIPDDMHPAVVLPELRDGAWLRARFTLRDGGVSVEGLEAVPLFTQNNFLEIGDGRGSGRLDIRVATLADMSPEIRAERGPHIARALGEAVRMVEVPRTIDPRGP